VAGNPLRSIGCHYDITERKLIEGELQKAKERLTEEKLYLEQEIVSQIGAREIIGATSGLKPVMENVAAVAPTDSTVLLMGETGTGKEVIARAIHENSKRSGRSFIKVNCAAIPSGLLESELFGAERGAFTGAVTRKIGRIELADGGTLFLDEIGEILPSLQPKLLRVLQEQEFERLGGTYTLKVDFRLIAATNRDLISEVQNNRFRSDLYYRLSVFPISLPPLRDRVDDIPALIEHFVQKYASRMGKAITSIPKSTMDALLNWRWPGNIRELENFIERSVILTNGSVLMAPLGMLDEHTVHQHEPNEETATVNETLVNLQREHIIEALRRSKGRVSGPQGAAARLGLKRTTLQSRMKQMGIDPRAINPFGGEAAY
jgi:formate hydrogenlyase transcriptional activator